MYIRIQIVDSNQICRIRIPDSKFDEFELIPNSTNSNWGIGPYRIDRTRGFASHQIAGRVSKEMMSSPFLLLSCKYISENYNVVLVSVCHVLV